LVEFVQELHSKLLGFVFHQPCSYLMNHQEGAVRGDW
jgi:hypothetical protein